MAGGLAVPGQQSEQSLARMDKSYLTFLEDSFHSTCLKTAYKRETITPLGGLISLFGCSLIFPAGAVEVDEIVELSVDNNPNFYPKSVVPITLVIGCKPARFKKQIKVKLVSWYSSSLEHKVIIFGLDHSGMKWEAVGEIGSRRLGAVEFEVGSFMKFAAGISNEDAERGSIHYFNDIWMDGSHGYIMSFLCRDMKSLEEWAEEMKLQAVRVIFFPTEIDVPVNGSLDLKVICDSNPELLFEPHCSHPFTITKDLGRGKLDFFFKPNPHPSRVNLNAYSRLRYYVKIYDAKGIPNRKANCTIPLSYDWSPAAPRWENAVMMKQQQQIAEGKQQQPSSDGQQPSGAVGGAQNQPPKARVEYRPTFAELEHYLEGKVSKVVIDILVENEIDYEVFPIITEGDFKSLAIKANTIKRLQKLQKEMPKEMPVLPS